MIHASVLACVGTAALYKASRVGRWWTQVGQLSQGSSHPWRVTCRYTIHIPALNFQEVLRCSESGMMSNPCIQEISDTLCAYRRAEGLQLREYLACRGRPTAEQSSLSGVCGIQLQDGLTQGVYVDIQCNVTSFSMPLMPSSGSQLLKGLESSSSTSLPLAGIGLPRLGR